MSPIAEALANANPPPPNESTTCDWVIVPLLRAAGYATREVVSRLADNNGQFPDYCILPDSPHIWFLEAKDWKSALDDRHAQQALNYANNGGHRWVVLTNGRQWRLYDNYVHGPAAKKHVVDVELADLPAAEGLLTALGKTGVTTGALEAYARTSRLKSALAEQLKDENSDVLRAIWNVVRKQPGLSDLTRKELAAYLQQPATPGAPPQPQPAVKPPKVDHPPRNEEAAESVDVGLDELAGNPKYMTNRRPLEVVFPDGARLQVDSWTAVVVGILKWFGERDRLPPLPYKGRSTGSRWLLNTTADHPDRPMKRSIRLTFGGRDVYLDANRSPLDFSYRLRDLCEDAGEPLSNIRVIVSLGDRWQTSGEAPASPG